jgi:hypothetical protein
MSTNAALFLCLAACAVGLFAFLSVATWVGTHAQERKERDRMALLKTLAEHPGDSAMRVLEMLREQERERRERKDLEERKGYLIGGATVIAVGVGLGVMLAALDPKAGTWTVGLIPGLIGVVLTVAGLIGPRLPRA